MQQEIKIHNALATWRNHHKKAGNVFVQQKLQNPCPIFNTSTIFSAYIPLCFDYLKQISYHNARSIKKPRKNRIN